MATAKGIKKRLKTTQNIHKITKTMGLVATAKLKTAMQRLANFSRYRDKACEMLTRVLQSGVQHPLLERRPQVRHVTIFAITGNRGLCGVYNTRMVEKLLAFRQELLSAGKQVDIYLAGRKGLQYLKFRNVAVTQGYPRLADQPTMEEIAPLATTLSDLFVQHKSDEVWTVYTRKLKVVREMLLPFSPPVATQDIPHAVRVAVDQYFYWPDVESLLAELLPLFIKVELTEMFLYAAVSEQIARRMAMNMAKDNAAQMIKKLTRQYNRARQTQITKEILEIVGGAQAIE
jgi:F-type H+-transporting ATPase subunit gamma